MSNDTPNGRSEGRGRDARCPGRAPQDGSSSGDLLASQLYPCGRLASAGRQLWPLPRQRRRPCAGTACGGAFGASSSWPRSGRCIAVSVVAVLLIFSSVEQGIEFEAVRGLQVARGLFLGRCSRSRRGAAASVTSGLAAGAGAPRAGRKRLGELSLPIATRCSR